MAADRHIRNPFEMAVTGLGDAVGETGRAIAQARPRGAVSLEAPEIRRIATADIMDALRRGAADVGAARDDVFFIALIYPLAGILIAAAMFETRLTPLIFPLVAGFALLGPLAAVGLYEISRRRERGETVSASTPLAVLRSPVMGDVLRLGALLVAIFFAWLVAAWAIYAVTLGPEPPATVRAFATEALTTPAGWSMIAIGIGVGALFAAAVFVLSAISFPLLIDRGVPMSTAVQTSIRAVRANPGPMFAWGLTIAGLLVLGSLPALMGLVFVMPLLGHATWHVYRKVTGPAQA
ncbi:MAG: DUF2189 domain-containing protein [Phenylobacterium sp.]|jgi:uncharacterized membrane protein|uniref:DUF2189 domain-containing protein n=1 Tax=Phenylobacterium sp. TaxID=1871053 RepID=UPI002A35E47F|nr:DUF2189 domain-containing protein [Phenylobacterium sp.]MDX9996870.1 DUF2189 domain-containing protein [Phenylobacterium sp.]